MNKIKKYRTCLRSGYLPFVLFAVLMLCIPASLHAYDYYWISYGDYDGNQGGDTECWEVASNWENGNIPDSVNATVKFAVANPSFISQIMLYANESHTVGHLSFYGLFWSICNGSGDITLTTTTGNPTITVNTGANACIIEKFRGNQGFVKQGSGGLMLYEQPYLTGNVVVDNGGLYLASSNMFRDDVSLTINSDGLLEGAEDAADQMGSLSGSGRLDLDGGWMRFGADNLSTEFSGNITGTGDFQKCGTGTMILSGATTFTGTTSIPGGTLQLGHALALQNSTVELSPRLDINGYDATFGEIFGSEDCDLGAGTVITVGTNNESTTCSGNLSGDGAQLVKVGNGTLTLSGNNSYSGGTILEGGSILATSKSHLNLANSTLSINGGILATEGYGITSLSDTEILWGANGGGFDIAGVLDLHISLAGDGDLVKQGSGDLTLYGDNSAMTGDVYVQEGTLILRDSENSIGDSSMVTIDSGATLEFEWNQSSERIGSLAGGGSVYLGNDGELVVGDDRDTEFSGMIRGDIDDEWDISGALTKVGTGTLTLSGENRINRAIELREGTLSIGQESNLSIYTNAPLIFNGGELEITGTDFASLDLSITWATNGGGFYIAEAGHTFTVDDALSGAGGLVKRGDGTLILSGANTLTGGMTVESGELCLRGNNNSMSGTIAVEDGAILRAGMYDSLSYTTEVAVAHGGTFVLEGWETFGAVTGNGTVSIGANKIELGADNLDSTFAGSIEGTGEFSKIGSGTLTLTGTNTYSGGTSIVVGRLIAGSGSALGTGPVTVSWGILELTGTVTVDGSYTQQSGGTLAVELGGAECDVLAVTGTAGLGGTLNVTFADGYSPTAGATFDILDWGSISGTFDTVNLPGLGDFKAWDTTQLYENGTLEIVWKNTDGDSMTDYEEYIAGTSPSNAADFFQILEIDSETGAILFQSLENRQYTLQFCTNLVSGIWSNVTGQVDIMGTGGVDSMIDSNSLPSKYYKLTVEQSE